MSELSASVTIEGNVPWFSGHFPENPVLPGIAQLKMVADLIASSRDGKVSLAGLSRIKFRKLVRPGQRLNILVSGGDSNHCYVFKITSGDEDVCSGKMLFTPNKKITNP